MSADALLAVLDEMHIDTAVLVGNSMGCPIGLEIPPTPRPNGCTAWFSCPRPVESRTSHFRARSASSGSM